MFKSNKPCTKCGKTYWIQNKTKHLCSSCVYKINHDGKDRSVKKKKTGEKELFLAIWEQREHICNSCGRNLGDEPLAHFFSHIKSKGAYPELRLDKNNIELLCFDCHYKHEFQ